MLSGKMSKQILHHKFPLHTTMPIAQPIAVSVSVYYLTDSCTLTSLHVLGPGYQR